ncbi:MAG: pyridine nucleotide-disulfide oxidoreductase [Rhodocyclales bacterium GT-UBC]|nr:MAG: pyridine nucleotide-disulfide oxidoreductase [Rhodocyclales bacterium GT-UBC]
MNRRDFFRLASMAGLGASAASWAGLAGAATATQLGTVPTNTGITGRVVVIGGGMGGASVAKYLRLWGGTGVSVTLVERDSAYTSNILSNLVLNGQRTITSLQYTYSNLASRYGIRLVKGEVSNIDPVGHNVSLADGTKLPYDRLVVAPGVDFDLYPGLETAAAQAKVPHAWKAGVQTTQLRNMLVNMKAGQTFVLSIPAKPYRCPPGPYERACVVADWLKKNRPGSKVIVLDANPGIIAEPLAFANAFDVVHKGVIEYHPGVTINSIDATTMTLNTSLGNLQANVINAIPPHRAGKVVASNGLANVGGRWAGVDVLTYQSTAAPGVHVIGDASATTQPKAGHIANQEAKICADAILRLLSGRSPDPSPITNSACYSPITSDTASWLTAIFAYDPVSGTMQPVPGAAGEAAGRSQDNYKEMIKWFNTLMEDSFA